MADLHLDIIADCTLGPGNGGEVVAFWSEQCRRDLPAVRAPIARDGDYADHFTIEEFPLVFENRVQTVQPF